MERVKKIFGIGIFATLFLSMFFSFMVSLAGNIHAIDVSAGFCPQSAQDVFLFDEDESELANEHKILIEKNVIAGENILPYYELIKMVMLTPEPPHFIELSNDIFYPPRAAAV